MVLEEIIHKYSEDISKKIIAAAKTSSNEAEFRSKMTKIIEDFADIPEVKEIINLKLNVHEEYTLIRGAADVVYNRFIIEYEAPGSLRENNSYRSNQHSVSQLKTYIEDLNKLERHKLERMAGVAVDGHYFIFVRWREGKWSIDEPMPVTPSSTEHFLRYLSSLSTELALTPKNLIRDFGENTVVSRTCVSTFYSHLLNSSNEKVKTLFEQWNIQFNQVCGYKPGSSRFNIKELARSFGIKDNNPDTYKVFFSIHTYYATFIKLLAVQIASYYAFPGTSTALQKVISYSSDELLNYLRKMERGGIFKDYGINNFLEGDFFSWYLDIWNEQIENAVRKIISQLSQYSLITLDVNPEETRDLLKRLYQHLMPKELRHDLGEYYTPDWLAERLLNQLGYDGNPDKRLLDPACGSGTFLVLAIRRIRNFCKAHKVPRSQVLTKILGNIVGFDLNPLAVISARTNYLLALGDLLYYGLEHHKEGIDIPVYLADSILTPSSGAELFDQQVYSFKTSVGIFSIPTILVTRGNIEKLSNLLEECVDSDLTQDEFSQQLCQTFNLDKEEHKDVIIVAEQLFSHLMNLARKGVNGIWARIIKNAFAPLFVGKFDYVAGNPPWVNWENLPDGYRRDTFPLWQKYNLFTHKGYDAILGKSKDDISILMTYVSIDRYLVKGGKLGFLITQSVFKATGGGQGFRRFMLGDGTPIRVLAVDDMVEINPFEGVANRTSIVILLKGQQNRYPVTYNLWKKTITRKALSDEMNLEEIMKMTTYKEFYAEPVNPKDITSSWITARKLAIKAVKKVLGRSDYEAHAGVYSGGANAVYWVDIVAERPDGLVLISNITEKVKKEVENIQALVEKELIYPLVRTQDINKWKTEPSAYIIVTHLPGKKLNAIPETEMKINYLKTYNYLKRFKELLRERAAFKRYFKENAPFYSIFDIGNYTFAPYKTIWGRIGSEIAASVIGTKSGKPILPQETITLVPFDEKEEAHYFCAVLNSSIFNFAVQAYSMRGGKSFGSPHILENIRIPKFNPKDSVHCALSGLSQQAHKAAENGNDAELKKIEEKIDYYAAKLWGLTDKELNDIKISLKELSE